MIISAFISSHTRCEESSGLCLCQVTGPECKMCVELEGDEPNASSSSAES